ncbi:MAG: hypothetical protein LBR41_01510 [Rickettsiales bacterium]|jgi:hypothetical protein|nr:hypothetical protein [Rickettsiales bacterium]
MKKLFLALFWFLIPGSCLAFAPIIVGGIAGATAILGASVFRSIAPVDTVSALQFFSQCWTCDIFGGIMSSMSDILPGAYSALGPIMITVIFSLFAIYIAWMIFSNYAGISDKQQDGWGFASDFTGKLVRAGIAAALLTAPLPRIISDIMIEPMFNVGLSFGHAFDNAVMPDNRINSFESCLVATSVLDPDSATPAAAAHGAFSPKLRHNIECQLAGVHQMTGLGMATGWTMLNMAFNHQHMYKIMWDTVPIFPNIMLFLAGAGVLALFLFALLPIAVYFLEIFIRVSLNLIMLPLVFLAWVFDGWTILPPGAKTLKDMVNELVKDVFSVAVVGTLTGFSVVFMNAVFGETGGADTLRAAFETGDANILIDGLMMNNNSFITIVLLGIFLAMFMGQIPALAKALFKNVAIPDKMYKDMESGAKKLYDNVKKTLSNMKKKE